MLATICKIILIVIAIFSTVANLKEAIEKQTYTARRDQLISTIVAVIITGFLFWGAGIFNFGS